MSSRPAWSVGGRSNLLRLCECIEDELSDDLCAVYLLTQAATEEFDALEAEFDAVRSELDTVARAKMGEGLWFVACAYGFHEADADELIGILERCRGSCAVPALCDPCGSENG
ncbi:DUF5713 family protein [Nocardia cyriacigeorgica]|uniref:DUF5713 family protein n=1 Tax=Nocardia cyriacigeorgica TaxID=135487 RepID=UPI002453DF53|nr:DUF5713 family protein [Nocardia cyriacigeorgica]